MNRLLDWYHRSLKAVLTLLMGLMLVPVSLQILSRHTGLIPRYIWTEEAARFCFVWLIMVGSAIAVREGSHFTSDLLPQPRTRRGQALARLATRAAMLAMALVFAWHGWTFAKFGWMQSSEMSGINMASIYIAFPLAGLSWTLFLIEQALADIRTFLNAKPGESA